MKRALVVISVLVLLIMASEPTATVRAAATTTYTFQGNTALASFSSYDPTGCISSNVYILVSEGRIRSSIDGNSASAGADISISQYDYCASQERISASTYAAPLALSDFQVANGLSSATLHTTISVFDYITNTPLTVQVALNWMSNSDVSRTLSHFHSGSPSFIVNSHFQGLSRSAIASGTISLGATNLTPSTTDSALLTAARNGEVSIDRPEASILMSRGTSAIAYFNNLDASGCVRTEVYVLAYELVVRTPPNPANSMTGADLIFSQYDLCSQALLKVAFGYATLSPRDFRATGNLGSATLHTSFNALDNVSGTPINFDVNLTWKASGSAVRTHGHSHYGSAGFISNYRTNGISRPSGAWGSVSDGTANYAQGVTTDTVFVSERSGSVNIQ
jgi:hypothetical protein